MNKTLFNLLAGCLPGKTDCRILPRLAALTEDDWRELVRIAADQRVSALFYYRLNAGEGKSVVSESVIDGLRERFKKNAMRNLLLFGEVRRLVTDFHIEGIPVIALKGTQLAQGIYPHAGLREMSDIDLLVPAEKLSAVSAVMQRHGYTPESLLNVGAVLAGCMHLPPFMNGNGVKVEIHWTITSPKARRSVTIADFWHRAVPIAVADKEMLGFSPEDLLLHLCFHASYHHLFQHGLRFSADIAAIIDRYADVLDWDAILERSIAYDWRKGVYLVLCLAEEFGRAAVPRHVLQKMAPSGMDRAVLDAARDRFFENQSTNNVLSKTISDICFRGKLRNRLSVMVGRLFLSPAEVARWYALPPGSWRVYLQYPVLVKELIGRYRSRIKASFSETRQDHFLGMRRKVNLARWLEE